MTTTQAKAENASLRALLRSVERSIELHREALSLLGAAQQAIGADAATAAARGRLSADLMLAVGMLEDKGDMP